MCLFLLTKLVKKVPGIVKLGDQKCYHFYVTKYSKTEKEELLEFVAQLTNTQKKVVKSKKGGRPLGQLG